MNYPPIEPEGTKKIHFSLAAPFENWLLNDGYQPKLVKNAALVRYSKSNKPTLEIDSTGRLNKPATQLFEGFKKYKPFEVA